jgi:hypothetical protein
MVLLGPAHRQSLMRGDHEMIRRAIACVLLTLGAMVPGAAPARSSQSGGIEHAQLLDALALKGKLFHVQGLDLDGAHIWVTSVDVRHRRGYLHEFDRATGALLRQVELTDGPRYHPGGFSIADHAIWVPVAEYRSNSSAVLEQVDLDTLQIRRKIHVNDHLGCVAVSGHALIAGNWDSKQIYIIDPDDGGPLQIVRNPSATHYQDMKFIDGQLVAGGVLNRHGGTIDWIDYPSMKLVRSLHSGRTARDAPHAHVRPFTGEGMALQGRELYLLPEDGPSRLFHFRLDDAAYSPTTAPARSR